MLGVHFIGPLSSKESSNRLTPPISSISDRVPGKLSTRLFQSSITT
jgi:hypothetical protein